MTDERVSTLADGVEAIRQVILFSPEIFARAVALVNGDAKKVWIVAVATATQLLDNTIRSEGERPPATHALISNLYFSQNMALQEAKVDPKQFYANLPGFICKMTELSMTGDPQQDAHAKPDVAH